MCVISCCVTLRVTKWPRPCVTTGLLYLHCHINKWQVAFDQYRGVSVPWAIHMLVTRDSLWMSITRRILLQVDITTCPNYSHNTPIRGQTKSPFWWQLSHHGPYGQCHSNLRPIMFHIGQIVKNLRITGLKRFNNHCPNAYRRSTLERNIKCTLSRLTQTSECLVNGIKVSKII